MVAGHLGLACEGYLGDAQTTSGAGTPGARLAEAPDGGAPDGELGAGRDSAAPDAGGASGAFSDTTNTATGGLEGDSVRADDDVSAEEPADSANALGSCTQAREDQRGASRPALRRLSREEQMNTLRSLLGDVFDDPEIAQRLQGLPSDTTRSAGDFAESVPVGLANVLAQVSERAAELILGSDDVRSELAPCASELPLDEECVETLVRQFGERVWRRELSDDEVESYLAFHGAAGAGDAGLSLLLRRLLQSPTLVFHVEAGDGTEHIGRSRLTQFEVASRVAYGLTGTMPDAELLSAARDAQLASVDDVAEHARRLLDTEAARTKLRDFARFYAHLEERADPSAVLAEHHGVDSRGLAEAMRDEVFEYFDVVVYEQRGSFADLMTLPWAFPRSDALAQIYGEAVSEGSEPAVVESHPGLLHRPMMLLSAGRRTNPIVRGAHVRKQFLCADLPLPPDVEAVAAAQEELLDSDSLDNRNAVAQATSGAACQGCHQLVNPLGFAFEAYDQLGVLRSQEVILDDEGGVIATHDIDTEVQAPLLGAGGPDVIADSRELVFALATSPDAERCMAQRLLEYYQLRVTDRESDACVVDETAALVGESSLRKALVALVASEDVFWRELSDEN